MEKQKKIFVIDRLVIGNNHVVFNSGFLSALCNIYSDNQILFYTERSHGKNLKKNVGVFENLSLQMHTERALPVSPLKKVIPWLQKKIRDILFIKKIYTDKASEARSFFFTTLSTTTMYYANHYARRINNIPVYFVIHGEVEFLFKSNLHGLNKFRRFFYLKFIRNLSVNTHLIVLSEIVREKLMEVFSISPEKIILMRHPIIHIPNRPQELNNRVVFGHIGTAMKKKSSDLFFSIAHNVKRKCPNSKFVQIGKIEPSLMSSVKPDVELINENKSIPIDVYEKNIQGIDYSIFTFDQENYVYRDSGAVIDSIAYAKPMIVLEQDYFKNLFRLGGDIGFLCNDLIEMEETITQIINKNSLYIDRYNSQCENLIHLARIYSLSEITEMLRLQIFSFKNE